MAVSHVYQVAFPEAGHSINMLHVASVLAKKDLQIHTLVLSMKNTQKWLKATGQDANPNLRIEAIADGKWEDWKYESPSELVTVLFDPEYASAIDAKFKSIKQEYPEDKHTAVILNPLMSPLLKIAEEHNFKRFLLGPTAYYHSRIGDACDPNGSSKPSDEIVYRGIGGLDKEMTAFLGDEIQFMGNMGKLVKETFDTVQGIIFSNTNQGLEGSEYEQPGMPNYNPHRLQTSKPYLIGPILPPSYEHALDDPSTLAKRRLASSTSTDPSITFLNAHPPKSVVYITLGSVAEFTLDQAIKIISILRKYSHPWILLQHNSVPALEAALSPHPDGVITTWAPQLDVMLHPSTKCLISHGGFGTMIEGIFAGQAFLNCPVFGDQFIDSRVMVHLGASVGLLAENRFLSIMERKETVPFLVDDAQLEIVLGKAFGEGGDEVLEKAREASRRIRKRMVEAKATEGAVALDELRRELVSSR